ncbi:MAG: hypothetical protein NVS4B13_08360 [Candidatus Elarobacter sp.]
MTGVRHALFTGTILMLFCSTPATPAGAASVPLRPEMPSPTPPAARRPAAAALYSRRSRRLVQSYLRLKLLEMREADLERARKVVERKVGITTLLGETPAPYAR